MTAGTGIGANGEIIHVEGERGLFLNGRYRMKSVLGEGTFGRVIEVQDIKKQLGNRSIGPSKRPLAIKVVRDVPKYRRDAEVEASVLWKIANVDTEDISGCVRLHDNGLSALVRRC